MRNAHRDGGNEESPLVAIDWLEIEKIRGLRAQHPGPEVINLTRLGSEVGQANYLG